MIDVAVVIPVRNGAQYLGEALASVHAQTEAPAEVVVVDDGSTDESAAIAATFPDVRVETRPALGPAAARNHGVDSSTASLIAFLDADDLMEPTRLAVQCAALRADVELSGVLGWSIPFTDDAPERPGDPVPGYLPSTLLVRRAAFEQVGPFDPALVAGEFGDWHLRARDAGLRIEMLDVPVVRRRVHDTNLTRDADRLGAGYLQVARLAIERRRGHGPGGGTS